MEISDASHRPTLLVGEPRLTFGWRTLVSHTWYADLCLEFQDTSALIGHAAQEGALEVLGQRLCVSWTATPDHLSVQEKRPVQGRENTRGRSRTPNLLIRSQVLCPIELRAHLPDLRQASRLRLCHRGCVGKQSAQSLTERSLAGCFFVTSGHTTPLSKRFAGGPAMSLVATHGAFRIVGLWSGRWRMDACERFQTGLTLGGWHNYGSLGLSQETHSPE